MSKVSVIIAAAGKSERFGGNETKTFAKLDGRELFLRSLELFVNREDVCQTILVVAPDELDTVKSRYGANLGFMGVTLTAGGAQRFDSVAKALDLVSDQADLVAVHDAARPCVAHEMIDAVFAEAAKTGAAILATPVTATLKRVSDSGVIDQTVSRAGLWEAQTPQVFKPELLAQAYAALKDIDASVTDDAQLVESTGHPVSVVQSDPGNLKITTKADMTIAAAVLKRRVSQKPVSPRGPFEEAQW